jgi:hypothetical protein
MVVFLNGSDLTVNIDINQTQHQNSTMTEVSIPGEYKLCQLIIYMCLVRYLVSRYHEKQERVLVSDK